MVFSNRAYSYHYSRDSLGGHAPMNGGSGSGDGESGNSDFDLVRAALEGDVEQRGLLGQRLLMIPRIVRAINGRYGTRMAAQDLEDLAQDAFVIVWSKLEQFKGPGSLDPWVYRICQFRFQNYRRGLWRKSKRLVANGEDYLPEIPVDEDIDSEDPRVGRLEESLNSLPQEAQDVILLHHFNGMTFKEVAQHKRVHISKVKSRYYRGLERLRRNLGVAQGNAAGEAGDDSGSNPLTGPATDPTGGIVEDIT